MAWHFQGTHCQSTVTVSFLSPYMLHPSGLKWSRYSVLPGEWAQAPTGIVKRFLQDTVQSVLVTLGKEASHKCPRGGRFPLLRELGTRSNNSSSVQGCGRLPGAASPSPRSLLKRPNFCDKRQPLGNKNLGCGDIS